MSESGFDAEVASVLSSYTKGDIHEAAGLVPDELLSKFGLVGSSEEAQAKIQEFRNAGVTLPMLSLRTPPGLETSREDAKRQFMNSIRACAPAL